MHMLPWQVILHAGTHLKGYFFLYTNIGLSFEVEIIFSIYTKMSDFDSINHTILPISVLQEN